MNESKVKLKFGKSSNGVPYAVVGNGEEIVLFALGGPGNDIPRGIFLSMYTKPLKKIINRFKVYIISRKSGLSEDYTTKKMSDDFAEMIKQDLGGKVHAIIGLSYGGMILQHFAADYPDLAEYYIILSAAHKISDKGRKLDQEFAELMSKGKSGKAYAKILEAIYPKGIKRNILKIVLRIIGIFLSKHDSETFKQDVLIEAKAEMTHKTIDRLPKIQAPVIILGGDEDFYFPIEFYEEMYDLIPTGKLKIYHEKGHGIFEDPKVIEDILEYITSPQ
ncbi:MAG: alpha/beta hydrolase [archaeon]|nr:alpha/beta hydrolase [archaeon]